MDGDSGDLAEFEEIATQIMIFLPEVTWRNRRINTVN